MARAFRPRASSARPSVFVLNGYFDNGSVEYRYWKKLVCGDCGSVYEIKSARSVEDATRKFDTRVDGGNFLDEYAVLQEELCEASHGSGVVAMLVTDETVQRDGKECWPVYIAAVDHVVPLLKDRSFEQGENRRPKVYARIFVEKASNEAGKLWFHVPMRKRLRPKSSHQCRLEQSMPRCCSPQTGNRMHEEWK
jgi:hypothetical protein